MNWIKSDNCSTIKEVVERNTGMPISDLFSETDTKITNLDKAVDFVINAINKNQKIYIFGDYDADGITSTTILYSVLQLSSCNIRTRMPRRFSEGYGMSVKAVNEFENGSLIITVDNGIMAHEAITEAKNKNCNVIVIDHHIPDKILPDADIIVNPHCYKEYDDDFEDLCGAGLALKFAIRFLEKTSQINDILVDSLYELAAIGTIADVMPLVKDNRDIVIRGLKSINESPKSRGIRTLINELELEFIDEQTIGYKIGPVINALGRVCDDGAAIVLSLLTGKKRDGTKIPSHDLTELAREVIKNNEFRKSEVKEAVERANEIIANDCLYGDCPLIIYDNKTSEGLVGIVAGKIAEQYRTPCIVLTDNADKTFLKGSCRSFGSVNIKNEFDKCKDLLINYGGHSGAAGLSVAFDKLNELSDRLISQMNGFEAEKITDVSYDLEIDLEKASLDDILNELHKYAPYGQGNKEVVFRINNFGLSPRNGHFYKTIGEQGQHIKLFGNQSAAIGFDMADKYIESEQSKILDVVGTISENRFMGNKEIQIRIVDFVPHKSEKLNKLSSLLAMKLKEI